MCTSVQKKVHMMFYRIHKQDWCWRLVCSPILKSHNLGSYHRLTTVCTSCGAAFKPLMTDAAVCRPGHNLKLNLIPKCYFTRLPIYRGCQSVHSATSCFQRWINNLFFIALCLGCLFIWRRAGRTQWLFCGTERRPLYWEHRWLCLRFLAEGNSWWS